MPLKATWSRRYLALVVSSEMPRFYCPLALRVGQTLELPSGPARHVQVLRLQPGARVCLFNGELVDGQRGEFVAQVVRMGRQSVEVRLDEFQVAQRDASRAVHLALGMPANERMDWLVEKATEIGVASIQPLMTERSVLRLSGERADKKRQHWQSVAQAACEQCGATELPEIHPVSRLQDWLEALLPAQGLRRLLSLQPGAVGVRQSLDAAPPQAPLLLLSGPEGGLSASEESAAQKLGFVAISLGPRVLRAETAALAALTAAVLP